MTSTPTGTPDDELLEDELDEDELDDDVVLLDEDELLLELDELLEELLASPSWLPPPQAVSKATPIAKSETESRLIGKSPFCHYLAVSSD